MKSNKTIRVLFQVAIVIVWAVVLGLYIFRNFHGGMLKPSPVVASELPPEEWGAMYIEDDKIGYAHSKYEYEGDAIRLKAEGKTSMKILGVQQNIEIRIDALFNSDMSLKSCNASVSASGLTMDLHGHVEGDELVTKINSKAMGTDQTNRIKLNEPIYLLGEIPQAMRNKKLEVGDKFTVPSFSPDTMSTMDAVFTVVGHEKIEVMGERVNTTKVDQTVYGQRTTLWLDSKGIALMSKIHGLNIVTKRVSKEEALKIPEIGKADLVLKAAVPSNKIISRARTLKSMTIKISGVDLAPYSTINDGRQKLTGDLLSIKSESSPLPEATLPIEDTDMEEFKQPSPFVQSDDPRIIKLANEIIGDEKNSRIAAVKLMRWVYDNVEKKPMASIPSAVDVLETMQGDCNEHATLYAALARAEGIPTKIYAGLVYLGGFFYYHAWNAVYTGDWIALDPVMNQFPADATHIKFVEGGLEGQVQIIGIMGNIKIEVVKTSE